MTLVFVILTAQVLLGGFDNLWHHEITEDLPHKPWARKELKLHALREFLYAVIFTSVAWLRWQGAWTYILVALLVVEIIVTMTDFVVEDETRRLPKLERILHTVLAINFGATLVIWASELLSWARAPTGLAAAYYGWWSWLFTLFGIGVFGWAVRDFAAVIRLSVPSWQRDPIKAGSAGAAAAPRSILVTGGTGFIGRALVRHLVGRGDKVTVLTRDAIKARDLLGPLVGIVQDLNDLADGSYIDAIVNLAGEPLVSGLWTKRRKSIFLKSRLDATANIESLVRRLKRRPPVLINASAIGYYGDRKDAILTEDCDPQDIFMSRLCVSWEDAAKRMEALGLRVCRLRFGLVLGAGGGVLPSMALPMRFGVTTKFGAGRQWMSWIHLTDLVRLIAFAIDTPTLSGAINATAPEPVTHADFMHRLGAMFGRQLRLAVPAKLLATALGELSGLFLASQRVLPAVATVHGFEFTFPTLASALKDIFAKDKSSSLGPVAYLNETCPLCTAELRHYRNLAFRSHAQLKIHNIGTRAHEMTAYGLSAPDLKRRLFVALPDGTARSGIDAFITIWRSLPYYRLLARLIALPGIYHLADMVYDGALVPWLAARNHRRKAPTRSQFAGG